VAAGPAPNGKHILYTAFDSQLGAPPRFALSPFGQPDTAKDLFETDSRNNVYAVRSQA